MVKDSAVMCWLPKWLSQAVTIGIVAFVFAFAAGEGGLRVVRWVTSWTSNPRLNYMDLNLWVGHPYNRWTLRPNTTYRTARNFVHTNSLGYRGPEFKRPKPTSMFRILVLGGSTVFGSGMLGDEYAWPAVLEYKLESMLTGNDAEVVNGGVPGYSSADVITRFALGGTEVEPDMVIFYENVNDAMNNIPDEGRVFRHDYSHRYHPYAPPIWSHSLLVSAVMKRIKIFLAGNQTTYRQFNPDGIDVFERNIQTFVAIARSMDTIPILVNQAHRFDKRKLHFHNHAPGLTALIMKEHAARMRRVAYGTGSLFVDVHGQLRGEKEWFLDDAHLSVAGNDRVATIVAEAIFPMIEQALNNSDK